MLLYEQLNAVVDQHVQHQHTVSFYTPSLPHFHNNLQVIYYYDITETKTHKIKESPCILCPILGLIVTIELAKIMKLCEINSFCLVPSFALCSCMNSSNPCMLSQPKETFFCWERNFSCFEIITP